MKQRGGGARPRGQHLKGFRYDEAAGLAYFSVYLPGGGGESRHRATVEASTWEEAVHKWTEFRARALKGEARPGHVLTFREFIAAYMDDIAAQVSAKTFGAFDDEAGSVRISARAERSAWSAPASAIRTRAASAAAFDRTAMPRRTRSRG